MILHIPHSSTDTKGVFIPDSIKDELEIMTDWYTDELFFHPGADRSIFSISRLVCDVERYIDIDKEEMESYGMGVCYTHRSDGTILREVTDNERSRIIEKYYKPHHESLVNMIYSQLSLVETVYLVDCHSFSGTKLNHEESLERPDICLGIDLEQTPADMTLELQHYFTSLGYSVCVNSPFSGTMIPGEYKGNPNFKSIMIEVNRDHYVTSDFQKTSNFEKVRGDIEGALDIISRLEML